MVSDTVRSSPKHQRDGGNIIGLIATCAFHPFDRPNYRIGGWTKGAENGKVVAAEMEGQDHEEVEKLEWRHPGFEWRR